VKTELTLFSQLKQKVSYFYDKLRFHALEKKTGRKLAISIVETVTAALFKQTANIVTKKRVYDILEPPCSYKTLVVNMNRSFSLALIIFHLLLKVNRDKQHLVKHTDSTDIPVCLPKNAKRHKTMSGYATWGHNGKGSFYGLKMHLTADLRRNILAVKFSDGGTDDRRMCIPLNQDLLGLFVADAGYVAEWLEKDFYVEGQRWILIKPKKNQKKLATMFDLWLYSTRMAIEIPFRNLKLFYGLVTSLPRSVMGYFANYTYALLAYLLA